MNIRKIIFYIKRKFNPEYKIIELAREMSVQQEAHWNDFINMK